MTVRDALCGLRKGLPKVSEHPSAATPRATGAPCTLDGGDGHSVKTEYDERDMVSQVVTKSDGKVIKNAYSYFEDGQLKGIQERRSFDSAGGSSGAVDQSVVSGLKATVLTQRRRPKSRLTF